MRRMLGGLLLVALSATPAAAKNKHWHDDRDDDHRAAHCYVQPEDVRIIREYYEPRYRSLPPGLAKKYYRTGQLPPGWHKKIEPLPDAIDRRLVVLPRGYRRGEVDGAVIVYSPRTQVVVDIVTLF